MSKANFIYCEKKSYSKKSCDNLIGYFEDNINLAKCGFGGDAFNATNRDKAIELDDLEIPLHLAGGNSFWGLVDSIKKGVENYKKIYPLINQRLCHWNLYHTCQLMKYEPNHYYNHIHCEADGYGRPFCERCIAWMIYLNDIKEGGGTEFIHQNFTSKPRAGDMYLWPAYWTHMHQGVVAPNECKYIITGWFSFTRYIDV